MTGLSKWHKHMYIQKEWLNTSTTCETDTTQVHTQGGAHVHPPTWKEVSLRNIKNAFFINSLWEYAKVHFRKAKFQNFPGEHAPRTPPPLEHTRTFGAQSYFCLTNSEVLPQDCYYQWVIVSIILRILINYKKTFLLFTRKRYTFRILYRDIYFKDCWYNWAAQAWSAPSCQKSCVRACY